ncbi:MAG: PepSY domain-containing protein [Pseudomonadota bacterium]
MASITYRALWRWHFHAGLFCTPFVIVLALSGSIYLFKPQIDAFADRGVDSLEITGARATGQQQIDAALASLPGSKLFVYEIPREADDAVRVHLYAADGSGRIVYVHPETLTILKTVPHTQRLTEIVRTIHGSLYAGTGGSILIELAASWAIVMLVTGLYLWWPRESRGLAGIVYPRLRGGSRVLWRDLHSVTGIWVSAFALFLLVTALPWTTAWGTGLKQLRELAHPPVKQDWSTGTADEHAAHQPTPAVSALTTPITLDEIVARVAPLGLDPPVRVYLPNERAPYWRVRAETQNRPRVRELEIDAQSGVILGDQGFTQQPTLDRVIGIGIAAHEGQLFGPANQMLGLFTALGLITASIAALVMWWRRRPAGSLGIPAPRVAEFRIGSGLWIAIVATAAFLPVLGVSLLCLWIFDRIARLLAKQTT